MKTKFMSLCVWALTGCAFAGFWDNVSSALKSSNTVQAVSGANVSASSLASLSADQAVAGLKEALGKGIQNAVKNLGRDGGFMTNPEVKVTLPEKLQKVEASLRLAGQGKLADDFVATMNSAAEQAVPAAVGIFAGAVSKMSFADAKTILSGPDNAATEYFRRNTQTNLFNAFLPIVASATEKVGVTATYKKMTAKASTAQSLGSLVGVKTPALLSQTDLDDYVANKALEGLFKMVAAEEKNIRENPAARTTSLLKTVFGAAQK